MDSARFDDLTRALAGVRSRRAVVRGAAGALAAAFGLRLRGPGPRPGGPFGRSATRPETRASPGW